MNERQRMDIKSFRALGYLQELNRRFLHLFGLALEVVLDKETGMVEPVPGSREDSGIVDAYDYHIAEMYFSVSSLYEAPLYAHEKHDECLEVFRQWRWITGSNMVEETDKAIGWIK